MDTLGYIANFGLLILVLWLVLCMWFASGCVWVTTLLFNVIRHKVWDYHLHHHQQKIELLNSGGHD